MNKEKLIKYLTKEAFIKFEALPEDWPVKGNCIASGDDTFDRECENKIYSELERGNPFAWFTAKVTASWRGFEGKDYLGGCSYKDESEFKQDSYYSDLVERAIDCLADDIISSQESLSQLENKIINQAERSAE